MSQVGKPKRKVHVEPLHSPIPAKKPVPQTQPVEKPKREKVPA